MYLGWKDGKLDWDLVYMSLEWQHLTLEWAVDSITHSLFELLDDMLASWSKALGKEGSRNKLLRFPDLFLLNDNHKCQHFGAQISFQLWSWNKFCNKSWFGEDSLSCVMCFSGIWTVIVQLSALLHTALKPTATSLKATPVVMLAAVVPIFRPTIEEISLFF